MKGMFYLSGAMIAFLTAPMSVPVFAQDLAPQDDDQRGSSGIQEIVVTAEHREVRLQDVPIAITAATAEQLQTRGVSDAFDIGKITPSFNSNRVVGFGSPIMRGVGTTNVTAGDEPSVATYVDGFYQGSAITAGIPFNNIERIEVLKGPQGTLYGRNATGGLISIVTRDPSDTLEVSGSVGYSNYNTITADAYVTGPISDRIAVGISTTFRDQGKGFSRDIVNGGTVGRNDFFAVRGKLRFEFGDNNSLVLGGEYIDSNDSRANTNIPFPGSTPLVTGPGIIYGTKPFEWAGNLKPRFDIEQWNVNAKLSLDLGFANLVSLTQYKEVRNYNQVEGDGTTADGLFMGDQLGQAPGAPSGSPLMPQPVVPFSFAYTSTQSQPYFVTQELQLVSNDSGPFKWILGGFFLASRDGYDPLNIYFNTADLSDPFTSIISGESTRAYAAFAQATYSLGDLSITGGVRYSSEKKRVSGTTSVPLFGLLVSDEQEDTFNSFTYRLALDYRVSPGLLLYATTNKGFKSGTFVGNNPSAPAVRPEVLYAYEVGFKADPSPFVRINGSAYYYNYQDIQTFITAPDLTSLLQNAARAEMYGLELTLEVAPTDGLMINFGMGYEHAKYKNFPNASVYIPSPSGGNYPASVNATGNRILRTPELTANGSITYGFDIGPGSMTLNAAVSYTSPFFWDSANLFEQDAYALVDLSAKYVLDDERWSVTLWGKNVTNHVYSIYRNPLQRYDNVAFGDPATYGATIGFKF